MSRLRDSIFILRKKSSIFSRFFLKLYMNFNQVKHFYSDQGMIENSYLKSHIFTKKNWYFFFIISMKILTKILLFCYSLSIKKFYC